MKILFLVVASALQIAVCRSRPSPAESNTTESFFRAINFFEATTEEPSTEVPTTTDVNLELEQEFDRHKVNNESNELLSIFEKALEGYNKEFAPNLFGTPLDIELDLKIRGILAVSEVNMEIHLDLDVGLEWYDKRLKFKPPPNFREDVSLDKDLSERIWKPSLSLLNEKESVDHSDIFSRDLLRWYPDGLMYQVFGVVSNFPCKMSLQNFPLDTQICSVNIGSHGNEDREYKIKWAEGNYLDVEFINFVEDMSLIAYRGRQKVRDWGGETNFTVLVQDLMLQRSVGYFVIGAYFPAALVVVISWLAFWMESAGERMALGVTCVLTITTLLLSAQASSPRVSYIKAIDIYMGCCFAMVFATLVHSTAVGVLMNKWQAQSDRSQDEEQVGRNEDKQERTEADNLAVAALSCDIWSRVLFPIVFIMFNILYWAYYINETRVDFTKNKWTVPGAEARLIEELE